MSRSRALVKWSAITFVVSVIALWFIVPMFPGGEAGQVRIVLRQALFWPFAVSVLGFAIGLVVLLMSFLVGRVRESSHPDRVDDR